MTSKEIIEIMRSIKDVKIDEDNNFRVKFNDSDPSLFPEGWEFNSGYNYGSFTEQLLLLIEDALNGKFKSNNNSIIEK